jgi:hypothetical protein
MKNPVLKIHKEELTKLVKKMIDNGEYLSEIEAYKNGYLASMVVNKQLSVTEGKQWMEEIK